MRYLKDFTEAVVLTAIAVAVIFLPISCSVFNYKECKKVGHSTLYCVMHLGK